MKEIIFDLLSVGKPAKAFSLNPEVKKKKQTGILILFTQSHTDQQWIPSGQKDELSSFLLLSPVSQGS